MALSGGHRGIYFLALFLASERDDNSAKRSVDGQRKKGGKKKDFSNAGVHMRLR